MGLRWLGFVPSLALTAASFLGLRLSHCSRGRFFRFLLQVRQAATRLSYRSGPPSDFGMAWSSSSLWRLPDRLQ